MPVMMSRRLFWNRPLVTVAIAPVWGIAVDPMEEDRIARVSIRRSKDASNSLSTADSRHGRSHCKLEATRAVSACTSALREHVSRSRSHVERLCPRVPRLTRARICCSIENNNKNLPLSLAAAGGEARGLNLIERNRPKTDRQ